MIKNLAIAALLGLVSANELKQKNANGEEFPVFVLARQHTPATPMIEIIPAGQEPMGFVSKIVAVPQAINFGADRAPVQQQMYHHQQPIQHQPNVIPQQHHSQSSANTGVKVTNVRTFEDPDFATKETTSKCQGDQCMIKECVGGNCKEFTENKKTGQTQMISKKPTLEQSHPQHHVSQTAHKQVAEHKQKDVDMHKEFQKALMKQKIEKKIEEKKKETKEDGTQKDKVRTPESVAAKTVNVDKQSNHLHVPKKEELSKLQQSNQSSNSLAKANTTQVKQILVEQKVKGDATSNSTTAATTNVSVAATETSEEQKIKVSKEQEEKESKLSKENLTKMKNFGPTKGKIELNQKHQMMMQIQSEQELNEKLDAEVLAGEKTKEVADIEKSQNKIMMMQEEVIAEQTLVEEKMNRLLNKH